MTYDDLFKPLPLALPPAPAFEPEVLGPDPVWDFLTREYPEMRSQARSRLAGLYQDYAYRDAELALLGVLLEEEE